MTPPILRDVAAELESKRLVLRCPRAGDGAAVHEAVVESLPELRVWGASIPWALREPTVELSELFCRESHAAFIKRTSLTYLVFERSSGRFVACTSLHSIDWGVPKFEFGFWCRSGFHRQGYTSEAVSTLGNYAFETLGARRVSCMTDALNAASRALCESVGMRLEGTLLNEATAPDGQLRDTCIYAITR